MASKLSQKSLDVRNFILSVFRKEAPATKATLKKLMNVYKNVDNKDITSKYGESIIASFLSIYKFKNYNEFAEKSIDDILEGKTKNMIIRSATEFRSLVLINKKNSFTQIPLPPEAQIAPIYGIQFYDFNRDGYTDIITAGNFFNREIETTRSDAGMGNILINDSKGSFGNIVSSVTGLVLNQDCREIYLSTTKNKPYIIAVNNNSEIQINKIN